MLKEKHPKILVVNDDPASLLGLIGLLSQWKDEISYEIVAARSGEEALRQALHHDFAVILLDVNMPGMDGFETAEAIHLRAVSASTPIIFVTAYLADEMNRLKGYQKGAVDYLFTPIIPQILKAKLAVFVGLARKNIELIAINTQLEHEISERRIAERQNKAKDEFLAMLGHELRNPISAISAAASLICLPNVPSEHIERAKDVIRRQSQQLSRIVDDLLDLSRVMSGKILLARQRVEFSKLINSCVETLKVAGRTKGFTLNVSARAAWVDADPTRLEQIISNLLDNALKYTPDGGRIDIEAGPEADQVVLRVKDSGVGIPAELLPHVFDVFVQGETSLDRSQGGLGIGLALVRQLALLHGGTVTADSDGSGSGSTFVIQLPQAVSTEATTGESAVPASPVHYRVLLIEDNEDGREMMSMMLASYGNQVLKAADGFEGLRIAALDKPDIALVDIGLPGMDGYEVARRLRADPGTREIKLIALTGYGLEEDYQRAMKAGFDMHLVKPVNTDHLIKTIGMCTSAFEQIDSKV